MAGDAGVRIMVDTARAEALVQTMERDTAFQSEVQAAHTVAAKRRVLDAHGFRDVSVDDMRVYVESKGGTFVAPPTDGELSDADLAAISGGMSDLEIGLLSGTAVFYFGAISAAAT